MGLEIEHKYLVKDDSYKQLASASSEIRQGFLSRDPERTVRVRTRDKKGYITIKGKGTGAAHPEFEYEVPLEDALQMMSLCKPPVIEKTRYIVQHEGNKWEVDEFHGALQGIVVAELEIPSEDYHFSLPSFIGQEVTGDRRYYNSQLGLGPLPETD
ncbi:MAG: CYTH domain-containing protein [Muribaculaceae bacterium]|nr:CYTH domain-containing protein [Muribaculaceae bacterium]